MVGGPVGGKIVRLPAVNLLVLLGTLLIALGATGSGVRYLVAGGAILGLGLVLFWDEGRWTRALIRGGDAPAPPLARSRTVVEAPDILPWSMALHLLRMAGGGTDHLLPPMRESARSAPRAPGYQILRGVTELPRLPP